MKKFLMKIREKWHSDMKREFWGLKKSVENIKVIFTPPPTSNFNSKNRKEELDKFINNVELEKVFSLLADRESQKIFWARAHLSQTQSLVPLYKFLIEKNRIGDPVDIISLFKDKMSGKNNRELILFGTTIDARKMFFALRELGIKINYVCIETDISLFKDKNKSLKDEDWLGFPMITEEELLNHKDAEILISGWDISAKRNYLVQKGLDVNHVWLPVSKWEKEYLDPEIMKPKDHEVYIDGGVLDLESTDEFIEWCDGKYDAVYAFEPDSICYDRCTKKMDENKSIYNGKVHLYNSALWNNTEKLKFAHSDTAASKINNKGTVEVDTTTIDSVLKGKPVTFIKLDIEGAELQALQGAAESIKKYRPRLAICLYHKPEDITEIPLYIHGLVPEYKMYIRHYSTYSTETVLLCVCDE